ncbi:enoyl-CoA hydratase/isomerase family protein, partial [Amycolatopsis acidicola]
GAGGRALSAGWDIHEMTSLGTEENLALTTEREEWLWRWYAHPLPTVAAVQGIAYGVGSYLAVCADLRVGGPATKLKVTGMSYGYAALTWALPDLIGTSRAKDMLFTGQAVDGARAAEIGLLNRYVGDDEVRSQAIALAAEVAALPGNAVRDAKRLMREAPGRPARIRYDTENVLSREGLRTQGAAELMRPFTERKSRAD